MHLTILCALLLISGAGFAAEKAVPLKEAGKQKEFCFVCHGVSQGANAAVKPGGSDDIVSFIIAVNRSIDGIDRNIKYLAEKQVDVKDLQARLGKARQLLHQFVHVFSSAEMESSRNILKTEISSLESETISKFSSVQQMDMFYIAAFAFNLAVIVGVLVYALSVYRKRKKSGEN
jgi:hypothetical protein